MLAPGRLDFWEEAHGRMKAFRQPFFSLCRAESTAPGKLFKLSLEAEMDERKPQQARAWSQTKSSPIIYNFLIKMI